MKQKDKITPKIDWEGIFVSAVTRPARLIPVCLLPQNLEGKQ